MIDRENGLIIHLNVRRMSGQFSEQLGSETEYFKALLLGNITQSPIVTAYSIRVVVDRLLNTHKTMISIGQNLLAWRFMIRGCMVDKTIDFSMIS